MGVKRKLKAMIHHRGVDDIDDMMMTFKTAGRSKASECEQCVDLTGCEGVQRRHPSGDPAPGIRGDPGDVLFDLCHMSMGRVRVWVIRGSWVTMRRERQL
jgi:hypothetical protein